MLENFIAIWAIVTNCERVTWLLAKAKQKMYKLYQELWFVFFVQFSFSHVKHLV